MCPPRPCQLLGGVLLASALRKAHISGESVGPSMVVVDAIDEPATSFYAAHRFVRLPDSMRLVIPMRDVEKLVQDNP